MEQFYPFFIVVSSAILLSAVFRNFHFPWVVTLLISGVIIGPHGFGFVEINETMQFLSQIGLIFLMFMAGLETNFSVFKNKKKKISLVALLNGGIPFICGFTLAWLFGFDQSASILLGIVFVSSSVAVIIPSLEKLKLIGTEIGDLIVASTVLEDTASLVLLSVFLQTVSPITIIPLPVFYVLIFSVLVLFKWLLPKLLFAFSNHEAGEEELFRKDVRVIFAIMLGTVVIFEILGLHPIIAGFFSGIVLSGSIRSRHLENKLRTLSYGLFIPVFFVVVGMNTNIRIFYEARDILILTVLIITVSILSKLVSGLVAGRLIGFGWQKSSLLGVSTIPQLSTTLAVVYTGIESGILPKDLIVPMVILSVVSVIFTPFVSRMIAKEEFRFFSKLHK